LNYKPDVEETATEEQNGKDVVEEPIGVHIEVTNAGEGNTGYNTQKHCPIVLGVRDLAVELLVVCTDINLQDGV